MTAICSRASRSNSAVVSPGRTAEAKTAMILAKRRPPARSFSRSAGLFNRQDGFSDFFMNGFNTLLAVDADKLVAGVVAIIINHRFHVAFIPRQSFFNAVLIVVMPAAIRQSLARTGRRPIH